MTTTSLSEPVNRLWRQFLVTNTQAVNLIEEDLEKAELPSLSWYSVLWNLERAPEHRLRLNELAQQVFLSRSNITRLIDRMEDAGLVCRKNCPQDRRGSFAALLPAGLEMRQQMWAVYSQGIAKYFADYLNEEEIEFLSKTFERISENINIISKERNGEQSR